MRFTDDSQGHERLGSGRDASEKLIADMAKYHEELQKAGVLLDASGLQPSSKGWRVKYAGAKRAVIDGPFAEAKELIAGYTIIQVKSLKRRWNGRAAFPIPPSTARKARSRSGSSSSWRILAPATRSSAFARWGRGEEVMVRTK